MITRSVLLTSFATSIAMQPVAAQLPSIPGMPAVGGLPSLGSVGPANAAGVLQYCVQHQLVSSTSAGTVLDGLAKKPDLTKSPDYKAGAAGQILGGGSKPYSLTQAPSYLKSQACDVVLKQAKHLL